MKIVPVAGAVVGLSVVALFVGDIGIGPITESLSAIGWPGLAAVCAIHLAVIAGMGLAWRALVPHTPAWVFCWGRLVRDAGSELLPFSQLGGCTLGARAVAMAGLPSSIAAASTIVDITLEFFAKLAYMLLGLVWLLQLRPGSPIALPLVISLVITAAASGALLAVQRHAAWLCYRIAGALGRGWADQMATGAAVLHEALAAIYRRKPGLLAGFLLHLACWIASAVEVWVALRLAGHPLTFGTVLVIESLLYGLRTFAFAIPNAIGVQEAAYVFIGAGFGLSPDLALALSLLKRARDAAIGLPTFAAWQASEGWRLLRYRARMTEDAAAED